MKIALWLTMGIASTVLAASVLGFVPMITAIVAGSGVSAAGLLEGVG